MRTKVFVRAAAFFALAAASCSGAFAAMIFSDDFNRANGNLVGTTPVLGTGTWGQTGTIATNPIQIASNAAALGTSGQDAYAAFTAGGLDAGGFAMRTSADITLSAAQATGDYFLHVSDPVATASNFYQRLGAVATTGGYFLTLAVTSGTGATTTPGTTVLSFGTTYHVDVDWNFVSGAVNDTMVVSVNGAPYINKTWDSVTAEPAQITAVNFRQGSAAQAPTVTVDNLTVEYIPEPTSFSLLLIGAIAGLAKRRSR